LFSPSPTALESLTSHFEPYAIKRH
jgi:hypothetical protein